MEMRAATVVDDMAEDVNLDRFVGVLGLFFILGIVALSIVWLLPG